MTTFLEWSTRERERRPGVSHGKGIVAFDPFLSPILTKGREKAGHPMPETEEWWVYFHTPSVQKQPDRRVRHLFVSSARLNSLNTHGR
jgi:hypothetical protein